ncbi:general transcription factor 3C polypeptide 3-like isoform X2 [Chenopodium quinoa]|uniref:general transcription factor 3C polypeptide 3-like isoform X2 n=1 Tax=Chenopodium quinoa TaxID=63459 RepID=UPI000B7854F4|nr:general transcription factor 3C polypeptide 3-like isoform X2 [Chenopodium quinoa]
MCKIQVPTKCTRFVYCVLLQAVFYCDAELVSVRGLFDCSCACSELLFFLSLLVCYGLSYNLKLSYNISYYCSSGFRLENRLSKHNKFLHHMRFELKDLVPPMIISGNQFIMISQHQVAAREYLEAHKQMPNSPLTNLCVGTALINLALGHRLQNKHQCVAQGLAFLYNNLRLYENSQEALYNIARAFHHAGLLTFQEVFLGCCFLFCSP